MLTKKNIKKLRLLFLKAYKAYRLDGLGGVLKKIKHVYNKKRAVASYQRQLKLINEQPLPKGKRVDEEVNQTEKLEAERCLLLINENDAYYRSKLDTNIHIDRDNLVSIIMISSDYYLVQNTINGLCEQTFNKWELILVQQPEDNLNELINMPKAQKVKSCISRQINCRFSSVNEAAPLISGDYYCLIEEDIIMDKNLLLALVSIMEEKLELEAVYCKLEAAGKTIYFHRHMKFCY